MIKKVFKIFFAWQDEKEESWLRSMSKKGWALKDYKLLSYTFEKEQPEDYIYKLDYKSTKNDDLQEYIGLYKDAGWEHVAQYLGWHYFRTKASKECTQDIYSTEESKIQKYQGLLYTLIGLAVAVFLLSLSIFFNTSDYKIISIFKWAYIILMILFLYAITKIVFKIRKLK